MHVLELASVAASFCFTSPPRVNLNLMGSGRGDKVRRRGGGGGVMTGPASRPASSTRWSRRREGGAEHAFSASNPYEKRDSENQRQFQR